jgi:dsDNA-specific endonuclease/ATPase MutS2
MKIFDKLKKKYPQWYLIQHLSSSKFSELPRNELYAIAKALRYDSNIKRDSSKLDQLKEHTYRYNSQTTKELASNLYRWCKRYL